MRLSDYDLQGYRAGFPPLNMALVEAGQPDGAEIDRTVAEETPCVKCGGGMTYHPFVARNSYRAFAVCTQCREAIEF